MFKRTNTGNKGLLLTMAALIGVMLLSSCGHRGDLYLPEPTETTKQKKKAS